jgi:hypothetical protein
VDNHFSLAKLPLPSFKPLLIQHLTALLLKTTTKTKMPAANRRLTRTYASANLLAEAPDNSQPQSTQRESTQNITDGGQVTGKRGKVQPAVKTSTDLNADVDMTDVAKSHPPTKPLTAKGKHGVLPRRLPNPARATRVAHPGAPDMKRGKQTTAEVTEAAKHKEEARLRLEMLEKEKLEILAKMEVDEELEDEVEEQTIVKDIRDTMSDTISEFVESEIERISDSEDVAIAKEVPVKKTTVCPVGYCFTSNELTCSTEEEETSQRRDTSSSGRRQGGNQSGEKEAFKRGFAGVCQVSTYHDND